MSLPRVCFVGLENLPVLAPAYNRHGIGGEQVQQTLLARALASRGWDVCMVTGDYGQPDATQIEGITVYKAFRADAGLPVIRFLHPRLTKLWAALRRADADVYYVSCAGMSLGVVARFVRGRGGRVVFRIAHDTDCDPENLLIRYERDKQLYAYGLRHADAVLAQSRQQVDLMKRNYGVDSVIAGMLVEPQKTDLPFAERDIDVLWVNNLRPFKRPDLALDLARLLPDLSIHMIGGPQPGHGELFERISREADTIPNLVFHGQVPYHDVNDYYDRTRVFVNTSDSEGFPNSFLQAWRRGVPLVTFFDPDGIVASRQLGSAAHDLESMAHDVTRFCRSEGEWLQTSGVCRRFMDERYGDDVVLADYVDALMAKANR